jgi:hypothetical protein
MKGIRWILYSWRGKDYIFHNEDGTKELKARFTAKANLKIGQSVYFTNIYYF